jgi:ketopantoate hydroxymethyltransferase
VRRRNGKFGVGEVTAVAQKKTVHDFNQMKGRREKITFLTAYDYPTAQCAEAAGLDMLLVGDSLGMCVYGYKGTIPVVMDQMIFHAGAVRRGAPTPSSSATYPSRPTRVPLRRPWRTLGGS